MTDLDYGWMWTMWTTPDESEIIRNLCYTNCNVDFAIVKWQIIFNSFKILIELCNTLYKKRLKSYLSREWIKFNLFIGMLQCGNFRRWSIWQRNVASFYVKFYILCYAFVWIISNLTHTLSDKAESNKNYAWHRARSQKLLEA